MKRSGPWLTASLQTVILLSVVACATPWLGAAESSLPIPRRSGDITLRGLQARPVYNGSVVRGGVYSADELRAAIHRDPVVALHYRGARLGEMQAVTLTTGKAAYVSYRRGDRVHWTRERVWLKAGETVLTDGTTVIRARCGNCVSDVKQENVAAVDPAHGELDDFVVPPTPETGVDSFAAAAEENLGDLLQVPFAPQSFAMLAPANDMLVPDLLGDPYGPGGFPVAGLPPIVVPGGPGGGIDNPSRPDVPGITPGLPGGGGPGGEVPPPPGGPGDEPPTSPPGFVPPGGGTGTPGTGTPGSGTPGSGTPGGSTSGSTTGGTTSSGSPTGSLTTGSPVDTTSVASTGTATGNPTTDTNVGPTTGLVTHGNPFPTTVGVNPSSSGATAAPEPGTLWLVAAGLMGLASRRLRSK